MTLKSGTCFERSLKGAPCWPGLLRVLSVARWVVFQPNWAGLGCIGLVKLGLGWWTEFGLVSHQLGWFRQMYHCNNSRVVSY